MLASARRRWPWLAINLVTALVASRVIGAFEPIIHQLVALAALMPIVASIGGNAGNQSVALVLQGLSHGSFTPGSALRMFVRRELSIAIVNGAMWGAVVGAISLSLYGDVKLACVLGVALLGNLVVAAMVGSLTPALLRRAGRDPGNGVVDHPDGGDELSGIFGLFGAGGAGAGLTGLVRCRCRDPS